MSEEVPRQYTAEEVREQFFQYLHTMIRYWSSIGERNVEEKMSGFVHSLLTTFDGCSGGMPGFLVCPSCHPDDPEYHRENGENWYPANENAEMECEISEGQMLHDAWGAWCRRRNLYGYKG